MSFAKAYLVEAETVGTEAAGAAGAETVGTAVAEAAIAGSETAEAVDKGLAVVQSSP